jgi:iron complex outermembrane receptor protein
MKAKFIYIFIMLCIALGSAKAQNLLKGKIVDDVTKEPLTGVTVYILELKSGTTSDKNGDYYIGNLPGGEYLLECRFLGYKSIVMKVEFEGTVIQDFSMIPSVSELGEIVVTGVTRATEIKQSPVIIKSIDNTLLKQNSSTNLIDALRSVPGINQISTGAAISKPIIRGLGYNRIITLFNGVKHEGQQWGDEHGIEIDEYMVDRIEIVKGPGSLIYGSDGIAGVINFLTPKPLPDSIIKTSLISNYQTNNNLIGYSLYNAGSKNGFHWQGRFSNKYVGNYSNAYDGKIYNSGFKEFDGSLFLGVVKKWGYSHLTLSSFNQTINMIEGERDSLGNFLMLIADGKGGAAEQTTNGNDLSGYKIGYPHQGINHLKAVSNNYFLIKNSSLNVDLAFQQNLRKEYANPSAPNEKELYFVLNTFNYNFRYNLAKRKGWESSVGVNGMFQTNENKGTEFLIPAYNLFDVGSFVFTQKSLTDKLNFSAGIRFDNRNIIVKKLVLDQNETPVSAESDSTEVKFAGFTENYSNISGSAGLSYSFNKKSTLKFNLSRGFRAPNIAEIGSNGKHEGTYRYEYGVPNLKPETSHQIDIAYFFNSDHFVFELTPFANFIQNYIFLEKLSNVYGGDSIPDPADPAAAFIFTQGNAKLYGGEIYFDLHPHPLDWLHFENTFSFVRAVQTNQPDSSRNLPFIPAPHYQSEIKAQFKKVGNTFKNAYVKFGVDYYFKQNKYYAAFDTETATQGYTLLSAGIGANIKAFKRDDFWGVYISANNITDVAYQSHLSRLKYAPENPATGRIGVYNMGRNFSVKLIMSI